MKSKLKKQIVRYSFLLIPMLALCSCDDEPLPQVEIHVLAECDSEKPVCIYGFNEEDTYTMFTQELDSTFTQTIMTNGNGMIYDFWAYCEDPNGVMKVTVYVDGEYSGEVEGRSRVYIRQWGNGLFSKGPDYLLTDKH